MVLSSAVDARTPIGTPETSLVAKTPCSQCRGPGFHPWSGNYNDLLCASRWETQIPAVIRAAENGLLPMARLDEAVLRVLRWKKTLGLL